MSGNGLEGARVEARRLIRKSLRKDGSRGDDEKWLYLQQLLELRPMEHANDWMWGVREKEDSR